MSDTQSVDLLDKYLRNGAIDGWDSRAYNQMMFLANRLSRELSAWKETAAQHARNEDFYRGLIDQCATHLGAEAYTADDGTVMDDPVRLKVPELVEKRCAALPARKP